jgi:hypothetical protein
MRRGSAATISDIGMLLSKAREGCIEFDLAAGFQHQDLQAECACGLLDLLHLDFGVWIIRVHEHGYCSGVGHQLAQQPQSFRCQLGSQEHHPGHIAAWAIETGDETGRDRIDSGCESDRYRRRCRLGRHRGKLADRNDRRNLTANQIARHRGQAVVLVACPAIFDGDVLPFDKAGLLQAQKESGDQASGRLARRSAEISDDRHCRLLRAQGHRPRNRRATGKPGEFAPVHISSQGARPVQLRDPSTAPESGG